MGVQGRRRRPVCRAVARRPGRRAARGVRRRDAGSEQPRRRARRRRRALRGRRPPRRLWRRRDASTFRRLLEPARASRESMGSVAAFGPGRGDGAPPPSRPAPPRSASWKEAAASGRGPARRDGALMETRSSSRCRLCCGVAKNSCSGRAWACAGASWAPARRAPDSRAPALELDGGVGGEGERRLGGGGGGASAIVACRSRGSLAIATVIKFPRGRGCLPRYRR